MRQNRTSLPVYPLLWLALFAFANVLWVFFFPMDALWLCAGLFLFALTTFLLRKRHSSLLRHALLSFLLLLITLHATYLFSFFEASFLDDANTEVDATLQIVSIEQQNDYIAQYRAKVLSWKEEETKGAYVNLSIECSVATFSCNDVLAGRFHCDVFEERTYGFPTRIYQRANGVLLQLTVTDSAPTLICTQPTGFFPDFLSRVRGAISARLLRWDGEAASLSHALLLGDKSHLPTSIKRDFSQIGASHILAISGLHLSVLCSIFFLILRPFSLPKWLRTVLLCIFLFFACFMAGQTPSVLRAACMIVLGSILSFSRKIFSALESLSLCGVLFALIDPHFILDIRFLLSFFATLGIVTLLPKQKKINSIPLRTARWILTAIHTSLAAIFFTLPIVAIFFGSLSIMGILSSLLLIPLCSLAILSALLFLLFPTFLCHGFFTDKLLAFPIKSMLFLAKRLSFASDVHVYFAKAPDFIFVVLFALVLVAFLLFFLHRKRTATVTLLLLSFLLIPLHALQNPNKNALFSFSTYASDKNEVVLVTDSDTAILIDCSKTDYALCRSTLYDLAKTHRKDHLDAFLCLTYSPSQLQRLSYLLSQYYIDRLFLPEPRLDFEKEIAKQLSVVAQDAGTAISFWDTHVDCKGFQITPEPNQTFTLCYQDCSLAYFNESWNRTQYQLERFNRLYKQDMPTYFLFSRRATPVNNENLTSLDSIQHYPANAPFFHVSIPFLRQQSHNIFLFAT